MMTRTLIAATGFSLLISEVQSFARVDPRKDYHEECSWLEGKEDELQDRVQGWGCENDETYDDGCPIALAGQLIERDQDLSCAGFCASIGGTCEAAQNYNNNHCQSGGVVFEDCVECEHPSKLVNQFDCEKPLSEALEHSELSHPWHVRCVCDKMDECDTCIMQNCSEFAFNEDHDGHCQCIGEKCYDSCAAVHGQTIVDEHLANGCDDDEEED